jgi:hypothetical protein
MDWLPLSGPTDLPCFVHRYQGNPLVKVGFVVGSTVTAAPTQSTAPVYTSTSLSYEQARANLWAKVRMETPVIYFYAPEQTIVSVQVQFPRGLMTEWYPGAGVTQAALSRNAMRDPNRLSTISWPRVLITPSAEPAFREDVAESHYYAARATDAAPLDVVGQQEKFLFYRGVADFDVPLTTELLNDGAVHIRNLGTDPLPAVILFENRAGRIGYRMLGAVENRVTAPAPKLDANFDELRRDLIKLLVASGLYEKEAAAMVETWRDSWFEEGTRVFYIVPPAAIEAILPLQMTPAPTRIARVFVGRMDIVTPAMEQAVVTALTSDGDDVIERFGRLLEPITERIRARTTDPEMLRAIADLKKDAFARYTTALTRCR